MEGSVIADRVHFAALIMFHYLFPPVTIGLGVLIAILKIIQVKNGEDYNGPYARAARFWAKLFVLNFGAGVATGIPMEFQFGTNWARFSNAAGGIIGQGLMLEGSIAFFLESAFLGVFLFGEKRVSTKMHAFSAIMVSLGSIISAFFITDTDAWMQHPVGYVIEPGGELRLTKLSAVLFNPFELWEYLHTLNGAFVHGANLIAAKTEGEQSARAATFAKFLWYGVSALVVAVTVFAIIVRPTVIVNYSKFPELFAAPLLAVIALVAIPLFQNRSEFGKAVYAGAFLLTGLMGSAGASLYPFLLPELGSTTKGLTIYNAAAPNENLETAFVAIVITMTVVIGYQLYIHRIFAGKVHSDTDEQSY